MMDEAEKYQQRLQAIAEKRRLQEEQERAKRDMEDERLRLQQLKRKSLRDQWLMEGPPLSPTSSEGSQGPRSPLWGSHAQDIEKNFDKLQTETQRLAEEEEQLKEQMEDGQTEPVEETRVTTEAVQEAVVQNGQEETTGSDTAEDETKDLSPLSDGPAAVITNGRGGGGGEEEEEDEANHVASAESPPPPTTNGLSAAAPPGEGTATMTFLGYSEAESNRADIGADKEEEEGTLVMRAERVIITDEGDEVTNDVTSQGEHGEEEGGVGEVVAAPPQLQTSQPTEEGGGEEEKAAEEPAAEEATEAVPQASSTEPEVEAVPQASSSTEPEVEAVPQASSSTEPEVEAVPQASSSTEPEVEAVPQASSSTEPEVEAVPQASSSTEPEVEAVPQPAASSSSTEPEIATEVTSSPPLSTAEIDIAPTMAADDGEMGDGVETQEEAAGAAEITRDGGERSEEAPDSSDSPLPSSAAVVVATVPVYSESQPSPEGETEPTETTAQTEAEGEPSEPSGQTGADECDVAVQKDPTPQTEEEASSTTPHVPQGQFQDVPLADPQEENPRTDAAGEQPGEHEPLLSQTKAPEEVVVVRAELPAAAAYTETPVPARADQEEAAAAPKSKTCQCCSVM